MPKRSKPAQNRRDEAPHQRAIAIGQQLQARMGTDTVELVVERALLVQDTIENIRRDPPRRETRHFGGTCESL